MKFLIIALMSLVGIGYAQEEIVVPPPVSKCYLRMGTSFPLQKYRSDVISRYLNIGLGARWTGTHGFDMCTNHHYNPDVMILESEFSYLFSPSCFKGIYIGPTFAVQTYFVDPEKFGTTWGTGMDAKGCIGFGLERDGRYSFIQFHVNRFGDLCVSSGVSF